MESATRWRLALILATLAVVACFRVDIADLRLQVPDLNTARDLVLVTNAAQHELMGELPDPKHWCEIDLARSLVIYREGPRLRDPAYISRVMNALTEAGYPAEFQLVQHDPSPPIKASNWPDPIVEWPDRQVLVLHVPAMTQKVDANRVADALAFARLGGRLSNLVVDPVAKTVTIKGYNRRAAAEQNFEHHLANAGFAVAGWISGPGPAQPPARGWAPFEG